jgi:hypothetical protein
LGDSKKEVCIPSVSLHGSGTWRDGSFNWNFESFVRHVEEGFGYGESLSLYWLHEGNLEGGFLYR